MALLFLEVVEDLIGYTCIPKGANYAWKATLFLASLGSGKPFPDGSNLGFFHPGLAHSSVRNGRIVDTIMSNLGHDTHTGQYLHAIHDITMLPLEMGKLPQTTTCSLGSRPSGLICGDGGKRQIS